METPIDITLRMRDRASSAVGRAFATMTRAANRVKSAVFSLKGAFAALGVGFSIKKILDFGTREVDAFRKVEAVVRATGGAAGYSAEMFADMAAEFQKSTRFGNESVMELISVLATFRNISGPAFRDATEAVLNMATVMGTDLRSTALQVGKALNDPIANMGALSRAGVQLSDNQKALVKQFASTGQLGKAQAIILKELRDEFGGVAQALRGEFSGAAAAAKNAFGDLLEQLSFFVIKSPTVVKWIEAARETFERWGAKIESVRPKVEQFLAKDLNKWVEDFRANLDRHLGRAKELVTGVVTPLKGLGSALTKLVEVWGKLPPWVQETGLVVAVIGGTWGRAALVLFSTMAAGIDRLIEKLEQLSLKAKALQGINADALAAGLYGYGEGTVEAAPPAPTLSFSRTLRLPSPRSSAADAATLNAAELERANLGKMPEFPNFAAESRALQADEAWSRLHAGHEQRAKEDLDYVDSWQKAADRYLEVTRNKVNAEIAEEKRATEARKAMWADAGSILQSQTGEWAAMMRQFYEDSGGQQRKYWEAYKAFAIAETVIATAQGVMNIWAGPSGKYPPVAAALSAMVGALGATKIALIERQEPAQSFATGAAAVYRPTNAIVGDVAGGEAIVPLRELPRMMAEAADQGGAVRGGGAAPLHITFRQTVSGGVDAQTLAALRAENDRAAAQIASVVMDAKLANDRGTKRLARAAALGGR